MKITCLIIDNDPVYSEIITMYVKENPALELLGVYNNSEEARKHLSDEAIMLLFLDMEMPGLSGLDFIRSVQDPPYVIFITSHPEFALESFEVEAVDYLLKPINDIRFTQAVERVASRIELHKKAEESQELLSHIRAEQDYFIVRSDVKYLKLHYIDVLYIEALDNFVKIYTRTGTIVSLVSLKNVEHILPETIFIRTHRSYLVNIRHISSIDAFAVEIDNKSIPLGASYKEAVTERIIEGRLIKR